MKQLIKRLSGDLAIAALILTAIPAVPAAAQDAASANEAMLQEIQERDRKAAEEYWAQQEEEENLSPKELAKLKKKREKEARKLAKQREKEEKARLKAEEKARKDAERQANGGKKNSKVGKAVVGCLGGAILGGLAGALLGGKRNRGKSAAIGAAAGCAIGATLGLTQKEEEELNDYVANDYFLRDDVQGTTFDARESGKVVAIAAPETSMEQVEHQFTLEDGVEFTPGDMIVTERFMRNQAGSLRMRGSPTTTEDNIVGGFGANDIVHTYGTTLDGEWTYIVAKDDTGYRLLGYAASNYLSTDLSVPKKKRVVAAKPTPVAKKKAKSSSRQAPAKRTVTSVAATRCKSSTMSSGGQSVQARSCGGASGLAKNFHEFDWHTEKGEAAV